jgi:RecG-like helicase
MDLTSLIIIVALIIVAAIIIRFAVKVLAKIITVVIVAGLIILVLMFWRDGGLKFKKDKFLLYELEQEYCIEKADTAVCECIVQVLLEDVQEKYSAEEILEISKNRMRTISVLSASLRENKEVINACLKEKDSDITLEKFIRELKSLELGSKLKKLYETLSKELEVEPEADPEPAPDLNNV